MAAPRFQSGMKRKSNLWRRNPRNRSMCRDARETLARAQPVMYTQRRNGEEGIEMHNLQQRSPYERIVQATFEGLPKCHQEI